MVADLLRKRCSVRSFTNRKIEPDRLEAILEAGRLSPSGGNGQPWLFGVITDGKVINDISQIAYKQSWIQDSPLLIVLCAVIVEDGRGAREIQRRRFPSFRQAIEEMDKRLYSALNSEEHQTKIAGTHMALQALEFGIYSTWVSYFDAERLGKLLNLPPLVIPSEILAFGYPAVESVPIPKKAKEEVCFFNIYK